MTVVETFAWIVVILAVVKIIVILVNPKKWLKVTKKVYSSPRVTMWVSVLLALFVLSHLLREVNIVQIFGVMLFMMLLMAASMSVYSKEFMPLAEKIFKQKNILKRSWLPTLIWVLLIIWVVKVLLA